MAKGKYLWLPKINKPEMTKETQPHKVKTTYRNANTSKGSTDCVNYKER